MVFHLIRRPITQYDGKKYCHPIQFEAGPRDISDCMCKRCGKMLVSAEYLHDRINRVNKLPVILKWLLKL